MEAFNAGATDLDELAGDQPFSLPVRPN